MSLILEFIHGCCVVMWFLCPLVSLLLVPLFIVSCSDWLSKSCVLFPISWIVSCDPDCLVYIGLFEINYTSLTPAGESSRLQSGQN